MSSQDIDFMPVIRFNSHGLFDNLSSQLRAGRAFVLVGRHGFRLVTPGEPIGLLERSKYTGVYEVDTTEHRIRHTVTVSSRAPGYEFEVTIEAMARVEDPMEFTNTMGEQGVIEVLRADVVPELSSEGARHSPFDFVKFEGAIGEFTRVADPVMSGVRFRRVRLGAGPGESTRKRLEQIRLVNDYATHGEHIFAFEKAADPSRTDVLNGLIAALNQADETALSKLERKLDVVQKVVKTMKDANIDSRLIAEKIDTILDTKELVRLVGKDETVVDRAKLISFGE